jgi:hypothetical protein
MGHLQAFDVHTLVQDFDLKGYIETGTGIGDSLGHALKFKEFEQIFSVDFDTELYQRALINFQDSRLKLINNLSRTALPEILQLIPKEKNFLFFLDAHFPKADFGSDPDRYIKSFHDYGKDAIPLEEELKIIKSFRPLHDVIIIDDVWIYEDGPFEGGNWKERSRMTIGDQKFVYNLFNESHNIELSYKQQGYLVLIPKKNS